MRAYPSDFRANPRHHLLRPDYIASSVADIDFALLEKLGVTTAFIDLDGTVVEREQYDVDAKIKDVLKKQKIKIYIATNRPIKRDLKDLVKTLNAQGVFHPKGIVGKPFPQYYRTALAKYDLRAAETVMIGDRMLQDIWGANAAGLRTIAVKKLDQPTNWFDQLLSTIEARYLQRLSKYYEEV